jgi:hypothetical protein
MMVVVFGLTATTAYAAEEFESNNGKFEAKNENENILNGLTMTIKCKKVTVSGALVGKKATVSTTPSFSECELNKKAVESVKVTNCNFGYDVTESLGAGDYLGQLAIEETAATCSIVFKAGACSVTFGKEGFENRIEYANRAGPNLRMKYEVIDLGYTEVGCAGPCPKKSTAIYEGLMEVPEVKIS